jgi:glycosyltransferase involved in cell wall biosynthesis
MISVLIPAYNAEDFIGEAIESVLRQTFKDIEVIVIDDGSSDQTRRIVESFSTKVRYYFQENSGAAAARNHCVKLSRGEFLAFLDADDIWAERKLELQMRELEADPVLEGVFGMLRQVSQSDWVRKISETDVPESELLKGYSQATMLIKRESFLRVGLFSEENKIGEFVDWLLRAKEKDLRIKLLPELFLWRRIHETNVGIRHRSDVGDYVKILKRSIDRRRAKDSN